MHQLWCLLGGTLVFYAICPWGGYDTHKCSLCTGETLLITLHSKAVACRSNLNLGFKTYLFSKHGKFFNLILTKIRFMSCSPASVTKFCLSKDISLQAGVCSAGCQASRFRSAGPNLQYCNRMMSTSCCQMDGPDISSSYPVVLSPLLSHHLLVIVGPFQQSLLISFQITLPDVSDRPHMRNVCRVVLFPVIWYKNLLIQMMMVSIPQRIILSPFCM